MSAKIETVGILAGEGELPIQLIQHCINNNISVYVVQFDGCDYSTWSNDKNISILKTRIEKVGKIFSFLHKNNVTDIVMIGNLHRPDFFSLRPDWRGIKTLKNIATSFLNKGDDSLLRNLRSEIENEGFKVHGIDYYLKNLTASSGFLTKNNHNIDMNTAITEALRHGLDDKGQSILRHNDGTYSHETTTGTSDLIAKQGQKGSILIKLMKPQQDPDLDRPTVGLETLQLLYKNKCVGMVIQANSVLMINKDEMIQFANEHNLFIEAVTI